MLATTGNDALNRDAIETRKLILELTAPYSVITTYSESYGISCQIRSANTSILTIRPRNCRIDERSSYYSTTSASYAVTSSTMALLQYRAPVDYEAQQEAFRDFLESFKSSESTSEQSATDAIDGLHLDGDGTGDEYDFMDDVENGDRTRSRREQGGQDKRKYMSLLQDIADRVQSNILIELDDLNLVRFLRVA